MRGNLLDPHWLDDHWHEVVEAASRDPALRAELADLRPQLESLDHEGAYWVAMLLGVLHDEPFVALELETGRGIEGRMSGVVDNFQLHMLLMEGFGRLGGKAAQIARGDGPQMSDIVVEGAWDLYSCRGLHSGEIDPDDRSVVWNEGTPSDIEPLDGRRVILLKEPSYVRTWEAQRTFDALPASLDARELSREEVDDWLTRLRALP